MLPLSQTLVQVKLSLPLSRHRQDDFLSELWKAGVEENMRLEKRKDEGREGIQGWGLHSWCYLYLLSGQVWMQHTDLHYWRAGYPCDRKKDGERVRLKEQDVWSTFAARCKIEFVCCCLLLGVCTYVCVCEHVNVCVPSLALRREHTHSQWLVYSRGEAITPGIEPCAE